VIAVECRAEAQDYLSELLLKQDCEGIAIRLFVSDPGTPKAETCIAYCSPGEEQEDDQFLELPNLNAYLDKRSVPFLEDAKVDYSPDRLGGQLSIRAPNSRMPRVSDDSPIEDKVNYVLHSEINPGLAAHGGNISLEEMDGDIAVLQFGGGCQGCGQADVTLKDGVERTLLEKIPELKGVRDITDHSDSSQAFYK